MRHKVAVLVLLLMVVFLSTTTSEAITVKDFTFPALNWFRTEQQSIQPKLAKLKKMEVDPIDSHIQTDLHIIEYLLLNLSYNYEKTVPSSDKIRFNMPDI